MKFSNIIITAMILFTFSCTSNSSKGNHGHEHGAEEHGHSHDTETDDHGHSENGHHEQEEFTVEGDSTGSKSNSANHPHANGENHDH